ncbi:MAG TPA: FAD:protein FMN transferase [Pararhizobium sp.]|uniref:FAD:protein FMN transferase n=1 Tax=Pararhizobium sp. TaxID=1977563 RepID=UPI002B6B40C0|nr:FAD:protein FMN transferase [Pararhizobium sp.]HTO33127.1 FAD:protein FMN transferase [Pararhizobium sp.]
MPKMSTDFQRFALNGPTMGTRWSAVFHAPVNFEGAPLKLTLAAAVAEVDEQMSIWRKQSDLNRLNDAPPGQWLSLPHPLMEVLARGLEIGGASGGAFDIGLGDATGAWGFGPEAASNDTIYAARTRARLPAYEVLELDRDNRRARKHGPMTFDLNGIAKGYGVDRLSKAAEEHGIASALLAIDGELKAIGARPDGSQWTIAIEAPDRDRRSAHSILELSDAAIATSGDYRHWVEIAGKRLAHTIDPARGMPLHASPASATVIAADCATADAWATAMMVLGRDRGRSLAEAQGLTVLFIERGASNELDRFGATSRPTRSHPATGSEFVQSR